MRDLGAGSVDDEEYEAATEDEIREAMEVCEQADALAAAGAYRKVGGMGVLKMAQALGG